MTYSPDMTFQEIVEQCHRTAVEHGWWETGERNFGEQIALMHSELSEALEEWRDGKSPIYYNDGTAKPEGVVVEFADTIIRIMDTCAKYDWPLHEAMLAKMEYNDSRPYRHGGKRA